MKTRTKKRSTEQGLERRGGGGRGGGGVSSLTVRLIFADKY